MIKEVAQAFDLVLRLVLMSTSLTEDQIQSWQDSFTRILNEKYQGHWPVENPSQGNGYRSISVFNGELDPVLTSSASEAGIPQHVLEDSLPKDLVVWIDPYIVSYRAGESSPIISHWEDYSRGKLEQILAQRAASTISVKISNPNIK